MYEEEEKIPEGKIVGNWIAIGIAIFSGLGIPLSVVTENFAFIGIGPAIGVGFGAAIGKSIEQKYKNEGRLAPPTAKDKRKSKIFLFVGLGVLLLGVVFFAERFLSS